MNPHIFWYTARASGLVAWVVLTFSVVWGLALSTRVARGRPKPNWVLDVHRYLGGTALVYTGLHMVSLAADGYVRFDPVDLLVPFASSWHPDAVAWGVAAFYLLAAVELTSLFKKRIPKAMWRAVHMSSFALLVGVWVHAFAAGSDMDGPFARWFAFGSAVAVLFLLAFRGLIRLRLPDIDPARTSSVVPAANRPVPSTDGPAPVPG